MYKSIEAKKILNEKFGWTDYGEKHGESVLTSWHINFYLFEKFGIDKRKAHLSSLINSGQMTRQQSLDKLGKCPIYPKLGFENRVMKYKKRDYKEFKTDEKLFSFISKFVKLWRF